MAIEKRVLQKAFEMGVVKGKTMGTVKKQVMKTAETRMEGLKKYKTVERTLIKPTTEKTTQQFGRALDILKEAKVVSGSVKGPLTLLQRAKANIVAVEKKEAEAQKEKMRSRTLKGRLEQEGVTGVGGRGLLDKIEKEKATEEHAVKTLEEARKAQLDDHKVSVFESGKPPAPSQSASSEGKQVEF